MDVNVIPIAEHHIESFRDAVGEVAREGLFLAASEAPPLESARKFVLGNIEDSNPQFVAVLNDVVIGWCDVVAMKGAAFRHKGILGMGVRKAHRRQGLGRQLLDATVAAAWAKGIERIELTVRTDNDAAKNLYDKRGFLVEGVRRRELYINNVYWDCYLMARLRPN